MGISIFPSMPRYRLDAMKLIQQTKDRREWKRNTKKVKIIGCKLKAQFFCYPALSCLCPLRWFRPMFDYLSADFFFFSFFGNFLSSSNWNRFVIKWQCWSDAGTDWNMILWFCVSAPRHSQLRLRYLLLASTVAVLKNISKEMSGKKICSDFNFSAREATK